MVEGLDRRGPVDDINELAGIAAAIVKTILRARIVPLARIEPAIDTVDGVLAMPR